MTAILGAGISGLSAAYYALQSSKIIPQVIFEASNRVGGWVHSIKQPNGIIFEQGPRTIRLSNNTGKNTLNLIEELGLSDNIIPIKLNNPAARNRLIYEDNQLHSVPNSPVDFIRKSSLLKRSIIDVFWKELWIQPTYCQDDTVYNFTNRRFGKDVADKLVSAMMCGICAGDAHKLSAKALLGSIFDYEQMFGSIGKAAIAVRFEEIVKQFANKKKSDDTTNTLAKKAEKETWIMCGIEGGLEQLPLALAKNITNHGVNIKTEHKCEKISFKKDRVELIINGEVKEYSNVISSLSAKTLADLVQHQVPELSDKLRSIPTVTVGIVNLQFSEDALPINAFGVLIPPKEEIPILGVTFDSHIFPQISKPTVLTVMMGGAWFEKYFGKCSSEEHLLTVAVNQVKEILHIKEDPKAFNVSILKDCIPQYTVGHMQRLTYIHNYICIHKLPLRLCGSSYGGVGLNDVILSAKQAISDNDSDLLS